MTALQKYGKQWHALKKEIPTRSVIQIRTHAQKFFIKVSKIAPTGCDPIAFIQSKPLAFFLNISDGDFDNDDIDDPIPEEKELAEINIVVPNNHESINDGEMLNNSIHLNSKEQSQENHKSRASEIKPHHKLTKGKRKR